MAQYFQLTPNNAQEPATFVDIDAALCAHLNAPCDPKHWYAHWYNIIGLALACGQTWDQIRADCDIDDPLLPVIDFLQEHYTASAWAGR